MSDKEISTDLIKEENKSYLEELQKIESSRQPVDVSLSLIDILVRDFLIKKFHITKNSEYDELVDFFLQKNMPDIATFCYEMVYALYSGEKISQDKLKALIDDLKSLMDKEQNTATEKKSKAFFFSLNKIWKKPLRSARNQHSVSKQIKKLIDLELDKYGSHLKSSEKENVLLEISPQRTGQLPTSINKSAGNAQYSPQIEEFNHPSIEHIDNLERIRRIIGERRKYRNVYA